MKGKKLTVFMITFFSILIVLLIFLLIYLLGNNSRFYLNFGESISEELVLDKTYDINFNEINIDSNTSKIEIKTSNDEKIRLVIYGKEERYSVKDENNKLNIKVKEKNCIGICFNRKIFKVELYLPENFDNKLIINNDYGDVDIGTFTNMTLDVTLSAGDLNSGSLKSGKIINKYGDININGYSQNLDIKEDCGEVYINEVNDIKVTNKFGDIIINKVNNSLSIKEDCGDVKIDELNINKDSSIKNSYGDIEINSTNDIYIDAKTSLGETKINNNNKKSDIILSINNSCGDIKVDN